MKVTIVNRISFPIKDYLVKYKTRFPSFSIINDKTYNGLVVEIDAEDIEDFIFQLDSAGFEYSTEDDGE